MNTTNELTTTKYTVTESRASMPSSCWGKYYFTNLISPAGNRIHRWGPSSAGTTPRAAHNRDMAEAQRHADYYSSFVAPRGYTMTDGVLTRTSDGMEIHLTGGMTPRQAQRELVKNHALRQAAKRTAKMMEPLVMSARVTMADARATGSCEAGILNFGRKLGIDAREPYASISLRDAAKFATPDELRRLRSAAEYAARRECTVMI